MGVSDITGVFSRYFVVGFFLPAYVGLVALWLAASDEFTPDVLEGHSDSTQLLILGGIALIVALGLSGLNYPITRAFEGYPLLVFRGWPLLRALSSGAIALQRRNFDALLRARDDRTKPPEERARAAWRLDQHYPHNPDALLPTAMGNAIRAFETHSNERWGLDGVTCWPRIEALLAKDEREIHVDAKVDVYVFVNGALTAVLVGICLAIDKAVYFPHPALDWPLYLIPFVLAYVLYNAAIDPVVNWGNAVRASIDLHRLELYEKLGVRRPTSFSDERTLALKVNQALLYGQPPLTDDLWLSEDPDSSED
jgi:hypothetical protein